MPNSTDIFEVLGSQLVSLREEVKDSKDAVQKVDNMARLVGVLCDAEISHMNHAREDNQERDKYRGILGEVHSNSKELMEDLKARQKAATWDLARFYLVGSKIAGVLTACGVIAYGGIKFYFDQMDTFEAEIRKFKVRIELLEAEKD